VDVPIIDHRQNYCLNVKTSGLSRHAGAG